MKYSLTDAETQVIQKYVEDMISLEQEYETQKIALQASVSGAIEMMRVNRNLPEGLATISEDLTELIVETKEQ